MSFYRKCAAPTEHQFNEAIFKRLAKQEQEHAELFARFMGVTLPGPTPESCPVADSDKYAEAHAREQRAITFYLDAARKATHPKVQQAFWTVADIETEHLQISNVYR